MTHQRRIVVVCGLAAEARIAEGEGHEVIASGGDGAALAVALDRSLPSVRAVLSFGVAGGLAPGLRPGDIRVARAIIGPDRRHYATEGPWTENLAAKLGVPVAIFAGADRPVADVAGKQHLHGMTGADLVDMESHVVADAARRHNLPFTAIRVVTDPADRTLPHAATVGMRIDGRVDLAAILKSLATNPAQLPDLVRTGLDARTAFAALLGCRQRLGPGFAFFDLG